VCRAAVRSRQVERHRALRKAVERRRHVAGGGVVPFEKEVFEGGRPVEHLFEDPHQRHEVAFPDPPVHEALEGRSIPPRIEPSDEVGRTVAPVSEHGHEPFDRLEDARHAAEGERRRAERHHFPIVGARVPPHDLNGIGGRVRVVVVGVQPIERGLERRAAGQRLQRTSTYII